MTVCIENAKKFALKSIYRMYPFTNRIGKKLKGFKTIIFMVEA